MAGGKGRSGGALLLLAAALLVAASLLAALPSCSAAAPASTTPSKNPRASMSPPRASSIQAVDVGGRRSPSSIVFPLQGNVYPDGLYYVTMIIGEPPRPYFLDVDTGSDLAWLHCDAPCKHCPPCPHPWYKPVKSRLVLVPCKDPRCTPLPGFRDCAKTPFQCDYDIDYADHFSSRGVLISDVFTVRLTNSSVARPHLAFGCSYDPQGVKGPSPVDGMLGLGSGPTSFVSQLQAQGVTRSVVGHCLGRRGTGYLFFGDALIPSYSITWAPMFHSANEEHKFYSPGPANLFIGKQPLAKGLHVVFDSGSSYTYFADQPYQAFLSAVKNDLSKTPLKETKDPALDVCWKGPFNSLLDVKKYFRPLALVVAKRALLEIPPENYLIITELQNACLGILNGTEIGLGQDLNLIGDISMLDLVVVYDNEKQQIGWARTSCDWRPKFGSSSL